MKKSCEECRKLRTSECTRPDHCVRHGYSDFSNHRIGKLCPTCGIPLIVQKTDPINGSNVVYTWKVCRICGYRVKITFDAVELEPSTAVRDWAVV